MTFPQELYLRNGKNLKKMASDPLFKKKFSYTGRMMMAGQQKDLNLIQWFIDRMKTSIARCPFYWIPCFNTDLAYREAKTGKYLRQRGAGMGGFCIAGLHMYPLKDRTMDVTVMIRNWGARRWFANLNGITLLLMALQRELPKWDFSNGFKVMAAQGQVDWKPAIIIKLIETGRETLLVE